MDLSVCQRVSKCRCRKIKLCAGVSEIKVLRDVHMHVHSRIQIKQTSTRNNYWVYGWYAAVILLFLLFCMSENVLPA